jgi:hypothetical protein
VLVISLGSLSVLSSLLLIVLDGVCRSAAWPLHRELSAAPLLVVALVLGLLTVASFRLARFAVMLAFLAWGLAQLLVAPLLTGTLNDVAIVLFVLDAAVVVSKATLSVGGGARAPRAHTSEVARLPPSTDDTRPAVAFSRERRTDAAEELRVASAVATYRQIADRCQQGPPCAGRRAVLATGSAVRRVQADGRRRAEGGGCLVPLSPNRSAPR